MSEPNSGNSLQKSSITPKNMGAKCRIQESNKLISSQIGLDRGSSFFASRENLNVTILFGRKEKSIWRKIGKISLRTNVRAYHQYASRVGCWFLKMSSYTLLKRRLSEFNIFRKVSAQHCRGRIRSLRKGKMQISSKAS